MHLHYATTDISAVSITFEPSWCLEILKNLQLLSATSQQLRLSLLPSIWQAWLVVRALNEAQYSVLSNLLHTLPFNSLQNRRRKTNYFRKTVHFSTVVQPFFLSSAYLDRPVKEIPNSPPLPQITSCLHKMQVEQAKNGITAI